MKPAFHRNSIWLLLVAVICNVGVWLYVRRVLVPYQIADAAAKARPRGNLSDLYPRWLATRELFLHGRNPYSREVTLEIQTGYYGRVLDASRPNDPKDQQAFAYPAYVVFFLAPTIRFPFEAVQRGFECLTAGLTIISALLWLRVVKWRPSVLVQISIVVLVIGNLAVVQALKLQQISLLVAGLLAISVALLITGRLVSAGVLLALASIKPQLIIVLLVWLAIWVAADWRRRYRLALSFVFTMAVLAAAAELYVLHWIPQFWDAVRDYRRYTDAVPVLQKVLPLLLARIINAVVLLATLMIGWRWRNRSQDSLEFTTVTSLVLAVTVLVVPSFAPYNQLLLVPAMLIAAREWSSTWRAGLGSRVLLALIAAFLIWQWATSVIMAALSFVEPVGRIETAWSVPFWAVLPLPLATAALMLVYGFRPSILRPAEREAA